MQTNEFLRAVVTTPEGWFLLAFGDGARWQEMWFRWPADLDEIIARANQLAPDYNVYFSSYLFKEAASTKVNVIEGTRTIQADLDNADASNLPIPPTILVQTSPDRHQAYWVLTEAQSLSEHERLSKLLTYSIPDCDRSGWPLGRKVRLPGTINHKYAMQQPVVVKSASMVPVPPDDISYIVLPTTGGSTTATTTDGGTATGEASDDPDVAWVDGEHDCTTHGKEILFAVRDNIPVKWYNGYDVIQDDRSVYLWNLMRSCFRAGLDRDQVFCVAAWSVNNKFRELTINAERELAKDVLRAENSVKVNALDLVSVVNAARQVSGIAAIKKQKVSDLVVHYLLQQGRLLRTTDEQSWYIDNQDGRPVSLSTGSGYLRNMLDYKFGVNGSETEYNYVAEHLQTLGSRLPPTAVNSALSYYNHPARTMYIHTGTRDVVKVTALATDTVPNGTDNVVFPWSRGLSNFRLDSRQLDKPWYEVVFGDSSFKYAENLTECEGIVLMRVWLLFVLMRHAAPSRPLMALIGDPGSGKSTVFKKVYRLLYGEGREVIKPDDPKDFDQSVANNPLVALDNQDGQVPTWLLNALAVSAGTSDIERRKLYTDNDTFTLKRQALIAISAHEPRFGRGDIADRMLIISLKRRPENEFIDEREIFARILQQRGRLWNAIVKDIQCILGTPMPNPDDVPHTRIQDFATTGYWIASALGIGDIFKHVIERINGTQRSFALQDDGLLQTAIDKYVERNKHAGELVGPGILWTALESYSGDSQAFKRKYHNASELNRKLGTLTEALRTMYTIESDVDPVKGTKLWAIQARKNGVVHAENE